MKSTRLASAESARIRLVQLTDGLCDWCERPACHEHHIARGQNRGLSLGKTFSLFLCLGCHTDLHELPGKHAVCIGLALLRYRRPDDYSLEGYYKLTGRRWPSEDFVEAWWLRILAGRTK